MPVINQFAATEGLDLATADVNMATLLGTTSILLGNGDGTFRPRRTFTINQFTHWVVQLDANHDGAIDLAFVSTMGDAASVLLESARAAGDAARTRAEAELEGIELTARELEQRLRRVQRGAEREELLASLEELASWYRDLVVVAAGAERAAVHADRLDVLREDATQSRATDAETAAELARESWRALEEFNLNPTLALEALFVRLRRVFAGTPAAPAPR